MPDNNQTSSGSDQQRAYQYIRTKVDQMLTTIGTLPLKPDELDDESLLEIDPIGIISESFGHILTHLEDTNQRLTLAHDEIHAILNSAGAAILVVDPTGRIIAGNNKINEFFNPEGDRIIGSFCRDVLCREEEPPDTCILQKVIDNNTREHRNEVELHGRCYEAVGTAIHNHQNNQLSHVVLLYSDITERINTEQELRQALSTAQEARERIRGILAASVDGLLVTDRNGRILMMNRTAAKLLRIAPECKGKTVRWVLGKDNPLWPVCLDMMEESRDTGEVDINIGTGDDTTVLAANISLLPQTMPQLGGTVIALRDVTRERSIERMKSEFVSTAAHEFRTPLAAIVGFSELMLNEEFSRNEQQEFLTMINEKAESLSRIVNNLLDISRIEAGEQLALQRTPTPLQFLLDRTVPFFAKNSKKHEFTTEIDENFLLDIDPEAIIQVLENILGNSVKYAPTGGEIQIICKREENHCHITVKDQGLGMTREQIERIFDKFYRGNALDSSIPGTGLGMTIVKHFVEGHGGDIRIESEPNKGTSIHFTLPIVEE